MRFKLGELYLGGLLVALLTDLTLELVTATRWTVTAVITWEYRPRMGAADDKQEHYQLQIALPSGLMYAQVSAATGTSSGRGDGETVSLKGESQLWTRTATSMGTPA